MLNHNHTCFQEFRSAARPFCFLLIVIVFLFFSPTHSQSARIFMDGLFNDWEYLSPLHNDPPGDPLSGSLDFGRLWVTNDENYVFFRLEVNEEMVMQRWNEITLYLDTDNNPATGIPVHGIGAELEWNFGEKFGTYTVSGNMDSISQIDIGLVTAPTVSAAEFEIALDRFSQPNSQNFLFTNSSFHIVFIDKGPGGDVLPDAPGGVESTFSNDPLPPLEQIAIVKKHVNSIRFLSYNVKVDGLFDPVRQPSFTRVLQAIQPQIIAFQEIYNHSAQETLDQIEAILPSGGQQQWYGAKVEPDIITISRYPISGTFVITGSNSYNNNGAFLIDLHPQFESGLLLINAHPPCCNNDSIRQYEVDAIMAFIRNAKTPGGTLTLQQGTPIMILGDMNLVGWAQQLTTLLSGQIVNTNPFGQSFTPDWDGGDFQHLNPRTTNLPMFHTWYSTFSAFSPGKLDYMIYSDSVIEPLQSFVLFTPFLPTDTLSAYNLLWNDSVVSSDHLPVVGDYVVLETTHVHALGNNQPKDFVLQQNFPNPFNPSTTIGYFLPAPAKVLLVIYDLLGRKIRTLTNENQAAGFNSLQWDGKDEFGKDVGSGVYIYQLSVVSAAEQFDKVHLSRKMVLLR